jgi:DNA invertase Pin-like site-specific DNA recombinase
MAAAEFERELIHERSVLGQKRYRAQHNMKPGKWARKCTASLGKTCRWVGRRKYSQESEFLNCGSKGYSYRRIARQLKIGEGTVRRVLSVQIQTLA